MLRIVPMQSAARAKSYFRHSDYYTGDQELPGVWRGEGAKRLGLSGRVEKDAFEALCDNRDPVTGERITSRTIDNRTVGYDFNFHAPKSVSLLNALTEGSEIMQAFQESVDETMQSIEADMQTRVRKGKNDRDRTTGEMVWGRFDHATARPVDGIPDPHLHSHCFVQNMTFDADENQWKAGQFRTLKRDAPFYQAVFHSRLAARLTALGYPLERSRHGWEVKGFTRATLDKFSRRTVQIDALAAEKGIVSPEVKAGLGAMTREGKARNATMRELRQLWSDRLDATETGQLQAVHDRAEPPAPAGADVQEAFGFAAKHLLERHSVVAERKLLAEMLKVGMGRFSPGDAVQVVRNSSLITHEIEGQRLVTSREVLAEEAELIAFARDGRGRCAALGSPDYQPERGWLNAGQRAAVQHVLTSPDRVMLIRGAAGSGKTSLMQEAVGAIERNGTKVFAFAPSADASRGVLRQEGFSTADTVARLLVDTRLQDETRGQVLWIDEAGLLGTQSMHRLFRLAERNDCRVILSGDKKQHGSVARGAVLRILETQAGVVAAEVRDIQRQSGLYKAAVKHLADGETAIGFDGLDALGWVAEVADTDRYRQLAADYLASVDKGETALVVSPTHAEGARVTATIRSALREGGAIAGAEHSVSTLARIDLTEAERGQRGSYLPGDTLQFHQNAKGFRMGQRLRVEDGKPLPLGHASRFLAFRPDSISLAAGDLVRITKGGQTKDGHKLENGSLFAVAGFTPQGDLRLRNGWVVDRDYGHLTYGYVTTSHAAQGKTVDHVIIAQSSQSFPATSQEQFYVSASRGRQRATIYTDDKDALRDAIQQSDDRMTATELQIRKQYDSAQLRNRMVTRAIDRTRTPVPQPKKDIREVIRD